MALLILTACGVSHAGGQRLKNVGKTTRFSDSLKGEMAVQWQISTGNIIFLRRSLPGEATRHVFYRVILLCRCTWCEGNHEFRDMSENMGELGFLWLPQMLSKTQHPDCRLVGECPSFYVCMCHYVSISVYHTTYEMYDYTYISTYIHNIHTYIIYYILIIIDK